jgi:hypothetical protein
MKKFIFLPAIQIFTFQQLDKSRDNVDGIATSYRLDDREVGV